MKLLVVYPHGLGDCILATPALRARKKQTGDFVGFAMLGRFQSSGLFDHNPYIDELFWTKDAWNDFPNFEEGCRQVEGYCRALAGARGYDEVIFVKHSPAGSKILDCAKALQVELEDVHTEVYISDEDRETAQKCCTRKPYGFVHTHTGVPAKDLPDGWGYDYISKQWGIKTVIEVGVDFRYDEISINAQFALLNEAAKVVVPDSVFFHAACALNKPVDLVYFAKGVGVYERVKPLHEHHHSVCWRLP